MTTLITPAQVVRHAFRDGEYLPPEAISEAAISAAEQRYLVPLLGGTFYQRLLSGAYAPFVTEYLAPAAALYTRLLIQPRLDVLTGQTGTTAPRTSGQQPAAEAALQSQRQSLRREARALMRRTTDYLAANRLLFPEYDPEKTTLNRCTTDGGFVQIL